MTVVVFSGGGTGGHLYPALSIATALVERRPDVKPFFVGAERGIEARVLPERGLAYTLVPVEGLRRGRILGNVRVLLGLARSAGRLVSQLRVLSPGAVVLTGGYASAPAGLAAAFLKIPIVLQEQNELPGLTTRLMARWAEQIHLAYPEAREGLPRGARSRALDTGNPIRPPSSIPRAEARARFDLPPDGRVVLVVGGSQGSSALNRLVGEAVREGVAPGADNLLWATGPAHFDAVEASVAGAPGLDRVRMLPYIDDMPGALAAADLAISRAGAMTTSELLAWGVPSVLVPLPTAAEGHQARNAEALEAAGVAVHQPESEVDGPGLWEKASTLLSTPGRVEAMSRRALARARPEGARDIADHVARLLPVSEEAP